MNRIVCYESIKENKNMLKPRIKEIIRQRGYRQNYVADQLGVSSQQLSNWINGVNFLPMDKAFKLARFLGVKVDDLYEYIEEE
jgi:transcriptional regulator with XRE-family HTH domain